jgi:hypothetical protein
MRGDQHPYLEQDGGNLIPTDSVPPLRLSEQSDLGGGTLSEHCHCSLAEEKTTATPLAPTKAFELILWPLAGCAP